MDTLEEKKVDWNVERFAGVEPAVSAKQIVEHFSEYEEVKRIIEEYSKEHKKGGMPSDNEFLNKLAKLQAIGFKIAIPKVKRGKLIWPEDNAEYLSLKSEVKQAKRLYRSKEISRYEFESIKKNAKLRKQQLDSGWCDSDFLGG